MLLGGILQLTSATTLIGVELASSSGRNLDPTFSFLSLGDRDIFPLPHAIISNNAILVLGIKDSEKLSDL